MNGILPILKDEMNSPVAASPAGRSSRTGTRGRVVINGRFMTQPLSGVQRYAREMVLALDGLLARENKGLDYSLVELIMPKGGVCPDDLKVIQPRRTGNLSGHPWEQIDLARAARGAILVNLTNSAPLVHRRQIVTIHDASVLAHPENFSSAYRMTYRILYGTLRWRPLNIVTVSRFSADELGRYLGIPSARLHVIPNSAEHFDRIVPDADGLGRHGLEPQSYVLAIGSRSKLKNLNALEMAMPLVPGVRPRLVVIGKQNARIFSNGEQAVADQVLRLGYVDDTAIKALYRGALCLVFPSIYEGFGLPPIEAMRCGCPVICSNASALPEVCGEAALYCDPADPPSIARQIARVRDDPALRQDLVRRGLKRARAFTWQRSAARLLELIDEVPR